MEILVNHLTRMAAGYVCVAGLDGDGGHIRPVLRNRRIVSSRLAERGGPFAIGALVDLGQTEAVGQAPEVEDHLFDSDNARLVSEPDAGSLWEKLEADGELVLVDIFGHDLRNERKGAVVPVGSGKASLGTLQPGYRPRLRVVDGRLRCILVDPDMGELDLSVTDVRFYRESPKGWVLDEERIAKVEAQLREKTSVMLSMGLGRPWPHDDPMHWLQVNNIHLVQEPTHTEHPRHTESNIEIARPTEALSQKKEKTKHREQGEVGEAAPRRNMFPSWLPPDVPDSEREVWKALGEVPDAWRVFHGVRWQSLRRGSPGDGEADFVLLHPDHGLIVIEVKGGEIRIEEGVWYTENREGSHRIDPFEQAMSSKRALLQYLHDTIDGLSWIPAGHAVWFPFVQVAGDLGPAAPVGTILDRADLGQVPPAVDRICDHWELDGPIDPSHLEKITSRLAPTFEIRHTLSDDLDAVRARIIELTDTQRRAFDGLRSSRRVIVYGGAGTGKTVLAIERARQLSNDGLRVLLTCFNRPLGDMLSEVFPSAEEVDAGSFHKLVYEWAARAGISAPDHPADDWWGDPAAELVIEAASSLRPGYNAVIIDEGQDFAPSWFLALEMLMADPAAGQFVVFADNHQTIYRDGWEPPFDAIRYDLDLNVRNSRQIAEIVARAVGDPPPTEGIDGPQVEFVSLKDSDRLPKTLGRVVHRLVRDEGLEASDIAILTQTKEDKDEVVGRSLAGLPVKGLDESGRGLLAETIHRFKGLESDTAIVVLRRLETGYDKTLAYIGLSRAKAHLVVIAPPDIAKALGLE